MAGFGCANLLVQINPAAAAIVLEHLTLPTFVQQGLQWGYALSEDRQLLLEVLRLAPAVFDGETWTRKIVALLAVELLVQHAVNLDSALRLLEYSSPWRLEMSQANAAAHSDAVEQLRTQEVPDWFKLAFDRVLARVMMDGKS